ncbi:hypothetical protein B0H13DRAFT_1861953 [Mycena leptocephala]|nr:hypothetical protein B0H13DRAFT_1861953 [Mycena leptocephala]
MDKLKSRFRLDRSVRNSATQASPITSASPADNCFTFRAYDDPSPSMPPAGSFESDMASSEYQQRWETWTDFENWIVQEQRSKGIELHLVNTYWTSSESCAMSAHGLVLVASRPTSNVIPNGIARLRTKGRTTNAGF